MSEQTINWGIIGCGDVTEVKSGPAFNKVPCSRLVAVMRRHAEKVKDYAERHGVPKWYTDAAALIHDPEVNAIYVATPPSSHEEYAIAALKAGKPVYLEKPMSTDAASAERIAVVAKEAGVKLSVAHYRRQQPLFLKIKQLLEEGAIGEVRYVHLQFFQPHKTGMPVNPQDNWRLDPAVSGGGLFHDLAPHQLDLLLYYLGKPQQASGFSANLGQQYAAADTVTGQIIFDNNIFFSGMWCFGHPERRDQCEITGTKGKIVFSVFDHQPVELVTADGVARFAFEPLTHVQQPMIQKVTEFFLGLSPNPCPSEDGVKVMKMIDAFTGKAGSV